MINQPVPQENIKFAPIYLEKEIGRDEIYYPVELEGEMGETAFHYSLQSLFYFLLNDFFSSRDDVLVAANMMVYYVEGNPTRWLAPDIFICFGVSNKTRRVFKTWEEGIFPQVIFEIASDRTYQNDLGGKRLDYARLGVEEYYLLDPERSYLPEPLMAFRRMDDRLLSFSTEKNSVVSPLLGVEIFDNGNSFGIRNSENNKPLSVILP